MTNLKIGLRFPIGSDVGVLRSAQRAQGNGETYAD